MSKPTDFNEYKKQKKFKQIVEDIDKILHVFDLTQRSLKFFSKYKNAQEVISICEANGTLLTLYKKKYEKELEKK